MKFSTLTVATVAALACSMSPPAAQCWGGSGWNGQWYGGPGWYGYGYDGVAWGWTPPYVFYGYGSPYHPTGYTTSGGVNSDLRTAFYSAPVDAGNGAVINVHVPPHARVFFDGASTQAPGPFRRYASPPLAADRTYTYEIRAAWTENGGTLERTRQIDVRRGQVVNVDFLAKADAERDKKSSDEFTPPPRPVQPPKPETPDEKKPPTH